MSRIKNSGKYKSRYFHMGMKIGYYRRYCGLTQAELAEAIERSDRFISRIEATGAPISFETFFAIADALHIEPYKLLIEKDFDITK